MIKRCTFLSFLVACLLILLYFVPTPYLQAEQKDGAAKEVSPASESVEQSAEGLSNIVLIEINGSINPATLDYINTGVENAKVTGAEALIIMLDTPGGLLSSTKEIVKTILNAPVPVIVYVAPGGASATSAGVFITLSANIAAMAPGTSIGAAHPVSLSPRGQEKEDDKSKEGEKKKGEPTKEQKDVMNEKILNYASSFIESIAERRGRNVEWAIDAVRNSASITSTEALELKVVDLISPNLNKLTEDIDGWEVELPQGKTKLKTKGAGFTKIGMNAKQRVIDILSTPDIAFLLLSLGSLGLLLEFYNPGLIFPGVAGVVCLLMGFVSFQILPFNYAGLVLLVLGIALFVAEMYVTSFGLLTAGGIISFGLGALLLFDTPESDVRVGFDVVIATTAVVGLFFVYVVYSLVRAQKLPTMTGFEGLLGEHGTAVSDIFESGKIYINGEYWEAHSDERISKGDKVEVVESESNLVLKVKKINST